MRHNSAVNQLKMDLRQSIITLSGNGWSQRRLERESGVDQTTISRLENGRLVSFRLLRIANLMQALSGTWSLFEEIHRSDGRR